MKNLVTVLLLVSAVAALATAVLLPPSVGHPVTPLMADAAAAVQGRTIRPLLGVPSTRPLVVVFILPGCPCSEDYEPYTHELFTAYGPVAEFVGIVAGSPEEAEKWHRDHRTPFRVLADPDRAIAKSYGAERSAYTAFVLNGQTVEHLWPGYSDSMLREVGAKLAVTAKISEKKLEFAGAPKKLTSGCPVDL
ncbi:MAG: redoxin domain-containing protein [Planctomycetota bacterium]